MPNIAKLTARYIARNPVIRECLATDMVNYSKLARKIGKELKIRKIPAIVVACRRYASSLRKGKKEETGIEVLKKSEKKIRVANKQAHITFKLSEKHLAKVLGALG